MTDYPDVPNVPGVPPVLRNPAAPSLPPPALLNSDNTAIAASNATQQWGIFKDGVAVILADSVVSFEYKQDWSVSDYPVAPNSFESYDKVNTPFDARIRMTRGGSLADREAFLQAIAKVAQSLNLYDVVTPEITYTSVNVIHYDYGRNNLNGAGLITIDVWLLQIQQTGTAAFGKTAAPSGADAVNGGTVQTLTVPDTTATNIFKALGQ